MKKVPETKIGTLQLREEESTVMYLHCFCAEAAKLSVDILNEQGVTYRTHKTALSPGAHKVDISLGKLPPGQYNAWITLSQVSGIRRFTITGSSSLKDRIRNWINR